MVCPIKYGVFREGIFTVVYFRSKLPVS
jgi:hypothetical protein